MKKRISKITGKPVQKRNYTKSTGRPTKYKPEYCQAIIAYFDIKPTDSKGDANDLPFILNFCQHIGISKQCLSEWVAKYPDFGDAYRLARGKQEQHLVTNTLQNRYNASFAWRASMNMFGWRDQQNLQVGMDEATLNTILATLPSEQAEKTKKALMAIAGQKKKA